MCVYIYIYTCAYISPLIRLPPLHAFFPPEFTVLGSSQMLSYLVLFPTVEGYVM